MVALEGAPGGRKGSEYKAAEEKWMNLQRALKLMQVKVADTYRPMRAVLAALPKEEQEAASTSLPQSMPVELSCYGPQSRHAVKGQLLLRRIGSHVSTQVGRRSERRRARAEHFSEEHNVARGGSAPCQRRDLAIPALLLGERALVVGQ